VIVDDYTKFCVIFLCADYRDSYSVNIGGYVKEFHVVEILMGSSYIYLEVTMELVFMWNHLKDSKHHFFFFKIILYIYIYIYICVS